MFIRKNKNRSGSTSVQIISKESRSYRVVHTVGSSRDPHEIARFVQKAEDYLASPPECTPLFAVTSTHDVSIENFVDSLENNSIRTVGPELIFGTLFDAMGFGAISEPFFRHLVIARLAYPTSKLKTVDYLRRYQGISMTVDAVYKALDRFGEKHKVRAEKIAFEHTKKTLGTISVAFYDMTTLYFEAEDEDDLRKIGFSKDGKFQCPQIMVGLLVGEGGYPIGYDIFEGNTFEGKTFVPTVEKMAKKYDLGNPIITADAGMLSKKNIEELKQNRFTFIVGGRVKNESEKTKKEILEKTKGIQDGASCEILRDDGARLIVTFSEKRRKKDAYNREKGLKKLRAKVSTGKLTKAHITNRGYNKFLMLGSEVKITIDETKIEGDARWDGLKGYVTNTALSHEKVIEHYGHLWQIEKAFRISKTDLRVRPIFHYKRRRIEAHLTIAFVAYAIWKELESRLLKSGIVMSPKRAADLTHTMYALRYLLPHARSEKQIILKMDEEQKNLYGVIHRKV